MTDFACAAGCGDEIPDLRLWICAECREAAFLVAARIAGVDPASLGIDNRGGRLTKRLDRINHNSDLEVINHQAALLIRDGDLHRRG